MPLEYTPRKDDLRLDPESMTEQEHKDSCDINKMMRNLDRGLEVRGGGSGIYGYDDTTMDAVQFRNEKARLEDELAQTSEALEFTEEELNAIPKAVREKYKFKKKAAEKTNELNEQKTAAPKEAPASVSETATKKPDITST